MSGADMAVMAARPGPTAGRLTVVMVAVMAVGGTATTAVASTKRLAAFTSRIATHEAAGPVRRPVATAGDTLEREWRLPGRHF